MEAMATGIVSDIRCKTTDRTGKPELSVEEKFSPPPSCSTAPDCSCNINVDEWMLQAECSNSDKVERLVSIEFSEDDEEFSEADDITPLGDFEGIFQEQLRLAEVTRHTQVSELQEHVCLLKSVLSATSTSKEQMKLQLAEKQAREQQLLDEISSLKCELAENKTRASAQVSQLSEHVTLLKGLLSVLSTTKEVSNHTDSASLEQNSAHLNNFKASVLLAQEIESFKAEHKRKAQVSHLMDHVEFLKGMLSATSTAKEKETARADKLAQEVKRMKNEWTISSSATQRDQKGEKDEKDHLVGRSFSEGDCGRREDLREIKRSAAQVRELSEHVRFLKGLLGATSDAKEEQRRQILELQQQVKKYREEQGTELENVESKFVHLEPLRKTNVAELLKPTKNSSCLGQTEETMKMFNADLELVSSFSA